MSSPIGFTFPFAQTTSSLGLLATTTTEMDATMANMKSLILTNWGERPNHFYMGGNLVEFLFAPMTDETIDLVVERIETQVSQWLPYVLLNSVDVQFPDDDGHRLRVVIDFSIRGRQDLNSILEVTVQ